MLALSSSIESVGDGDLGTMEPDRTAASFPKKIFLDGDKLSGI
jgi:hypothetical protein